MSDGPKMSTAERLRWSAWLARTAPLQGSFPYRSPDAIARAERRNLGAALSHAREHVPYYRETMGRLGLSAGDFRSGSDLAMLPLLDRAQVQADPEYFTSVKHPPENCVRLASGGSAGAPLTLFQDPGSLFVQRAEAERMRRVLMRASRRRLRLREATITPRQSSGASQGGGFRRNTLISPALRVQSLSLSVFDPIETLIDRINEFRPHLISGFGSALDELFSQAERRGGFEWPRAAHYAADAMSEPVKELATQRRGVAVFASYNSIEAGQIAFECEAHSGLHRHIDLCPSRIVSPDGADLPSGERGEVVVSNLVNRATMLLNYRLGDLAALLEGPCECGRNLPKMTLVEGRLSGEWLDGDGGVRVHAHAVKNLIRTRRDVLRYQIIQAEPGQLSIRLIAAEGTDRDAVAGAIEAGLRDVFGEKARIEVRFDAELQRTKAGKVLPVLTRDTGTTVTDSNG